MAKTTFYTSSNSVFSKIESTSIADNIPQILRPPVKTPLDMSGEIVVGAETDGDYRSSLVNVGFLEQQLVNQSIAFRSNILYEGSAGNLVSYPVENNPSKFDYFVVINNERFFSKTTPVGDETNFLRLPLDSFYVDHYNWKDDQSYRVGDLISFENRVYITRIQHTIPENTSFISYYGYPLYLITFEIPTATTSGDVTIDGVTITLSGDETKAEVATLWATAYNTARDSSLPAAVVGSGDPDDALGVNVVSISNIDTDVITAPAGTILYKSNEISVNTTSEVDDKLKLITNQAEWQPNTRYYRGDFVIFQGRIYVARTTHPQEGFITTATFERSNWITAPDSLIRDAVNLDSIFVYNNGLVTSISYGTIISNSPDWTINTSYNIGDFVTESSRVYISKLDFTSTGTFDVTNWTLLPINQGVSYTNVKFYKNFTYGNDLVTQIRWFENETSTSIDTVTVSTDNQTSFTTPTTFSVLASVFSYEVKRIELYQGGSTQPFGDITSGPHGISYVNIPGIMNTNALPLNDTPTDTVKLLEYTVTPDGGTESERFLTSAAGASTVAIDVGAANQAPSLPRDSVITLYVTITPNNFEEGTGSIVPTNTNTLTITDSVPFSEGELINITTSTPFRFIVFNYANGLVVGKDQSDNIS